MLLLHVIVALSSTLLATYLIARPTQQGIRLSYALITITMTSGIALMIMNPIYAIRGCIAYVTYTVFVTVLTTKAHHKSSADTAKN